jgi:PAS domain S-box-containing protein
MLDMAHRNALRLLKLVNTLLDFSRIEAGRIDASYEATDLSICTAELTSAFCSAVEKGGLWLKIDCPPMPEPVYIDREMWEKVVLNLLSNSFKHTFAGGIHVSLKWCGDHVELSVMDSGVVIPDAELPSLFDRFRRVKGAKSRSHEGMGIGLALVQELVRLHGGTVRVESQEGKGSTFTVTVKTGQAHLPAERLGTQRLQTLSATHAVAFLGEALHWASDISAASTRPLSPVESPDILHPLEGAEVPSVERSRILWADDNADMRDYVSRLLRTRYDVTEVSDGTTALATALATTPDLILTDIMMPGFDGFALLRELRTNERTLSIPVILLSARAGEESAVEGLEVGADDYLIKPFSARELLARVETHLKMGKLRRAWALVLERRVQELAEANRDLHEQIQVRVQAEDAFQQIMDSSPDVICTFDAEGRFLQVNRACEVLWGYRPEELKGLPYRDMIHPHDRERSLAAAGTVMSGQPENNLENRYLRRDGSVVPLLWTATWSQAHQIMFCVARDMTVPKQIESELLEAKEVAEAIGQRVSS